MTQNSAANEIVEHLESKYIPGNVPTEAQVLSGRMKQSMKYLIFNKMLGPTIDRYALHTPFESGMYADSSGDRSATAPLAEAPMDLVTAFGNFQPRDQEEIIASQLADLTPDQQSNLEE